MRIHPAPKKRNIAVRYNLNPNPNPIQKKLRRLPHIFSKVLELPFPSDACVAVEEGATCFKFVAPADDLDAGSIRAHAIEIYPGVMKVVIRDDGFELESGMELDRWRFRLPSETRPRLATADYVDRELIVTVPKGVGDDDDDDDDDDERDEFGIGQLVPVQ